MTEQNYDSIDELVKSRAAQLRKSPSYDPRKEKELDDLYNQYVPPHSTKNTSHLLDVAERDAYIDPFPPIGSQKLAGGAIKKGIRVAIGWYIQYIAQQISTFGSGVGQALRAINKDVDEIKKLQSDEDLANAISSLSLGSIKENTLSILSEIIQGRNRQKIIISDSINSNSLLNIFDKDTHCIVVDPRISAVSNLDPKIDTRLSPLHPYLLNIESNSVDLIVLHGQIEFLNISSRIGIIKNCARVLKTDGQLIFAIHSNKTDLSGDNLIAEELSGNTRWSLNTWKHVLNQSFSDIDIRELDDISICVALNESG